MSARRRVCAIPPIPAVLLLALLAAGASRLSAQTVTLIGTINDATTGRPVIGAQVSINDGSPRANTNAEGRFRLTGVPTGNQRMVVRRFGYVLYDQAIDVTPTMREPVIALQPDPLQLDSLNVRSNAKADVRGVVVDATTGVPVPFPSLKLTQDTQLQVGRLTPGEEKGTFKISDVNPGAYLLYVERIGYQPQFLSFVHTIPPQPLEVRLEPDVDVAKGLAAMNAQLEQRRASFSRPVVSVPEVTLQRAPQNGMRSFLNAYTSLRVVPCPSPPATRQLRNQDNCMEVRGDSLRPTIFIDGVRIFDRMADPTALMELNTYSSRNFYSLEYFVCPGGTRDLAEMGMSGRQPLQSYVELYVYSYEYMKRMAARPSIPLPPCGK